MSDFVKLIWQRTGKLIAVTAILLAVAIYYRGGMPALGHWCDLVRIILVLGVVTVLIRKNWDVGLALVIGALALGLLFPLEATGFGKAMTLGMFSPGEAALHKLLYECCLLIVLVFLINVLGSLISARDALKQFMEALEHLIRDARYVGAIVPAAIGFLPNPGGALITAPFVAETRKRVAMDAETCVLLNYWFRHIWEYWWLLFPAILYIIQNLKVSAGAIALAHGPLTIVAILSGWFFIIRRIDKPSRLPRPPGHRLWQLVPVAATIWPLVAIFTIAVLAPRTRTNECFAAGMVVVCALIVAVRRLTLNETLSALRKAFKPRLALLLFGVYAVRAMFDATHAAANVPEALSASHVPVPIILFFVPWIAGLLTGYTMAGVVISFSALMGLLAPGGGTVMLDRLMLAYAGSFVGVLMSPAHLCLILTRDYFSADLGIIYRRLAPIFGVTLVAVAGWWVVLRHFHS